VKAVSHDYTFRVVWPQVETYSGTGVNKDKFNPTTKQGTFKNFTMIIRMELDALQRDSSNLTVNFIANVSFNK